jgi:hypothetical protein
MFGKIQAFFHDVSAIRRELVILRLHNENEVRVALLPQKECSECFSSIDERSRRCPHCTTVLIA